MGERFDDITRAYVRGAVGVLLVYDVTQPRSFERVRRWMNELRVSEDAPNRGSVQILVGNKCDLETQRKVSTEQGARFASEHGLKFMETSARTNEQVSEVFETLAHDVLNTHQPSISTGHINLESGASDDWYAAKSCRREQGGGGAPLSLH